MAPAVWFLGSGIPKIHHQDSIKNYANSKQQKWQFCPMFLLLLYCICFTCFVLFFFPMCFFTKKTYQLGPSHFLGSRLSPICCFEVADCLTTPLREGIFDAVLSIAVRDDLRKSQRLVVLNNCLMFLKLEMFQNLFDVWWTYTNLIWCSINLRKLEATRSWSGRR